MIKKTHLLIGFILLVFVILTIKGILDYKYRVKYQDKIKYKNGISVPSVIAYIDELPIGEDDIRLEFKLHGLNLDKGDKKNVDEDGNLDRASYYLPLKERIITSIIERKLLYKYIELDKEFNLHKTSRYTSCLKEWQEFITKPKDQILNEDEKHMLKRSLCEKSLINQYVEEKIFTKIKVSEEEINKYFEANRRDIKFPKRVLIRQVVLASEREAKKILVKINPNNFAHYAKSYSISPERSDGGILGPFAKGEMPRIFDVAFSMKQHEIRGVLKSTYGFHIIMVEKKLKERNLSLAEAKSKIEKILVNKKKQKEYQSWLEIALNRVKIKTPKQM